MRLEPLEFGDIPGWSSAEIMGAWPAFLASCRAIRDNHPPLRRGCEPTEPLVRLCASALALPGKPTEVKAFFEAAFRAHRVAPDSGYGFVTGYYEPEVAGSLERTARFAAPVLSRPTDLLDMRGTATPSWDATYEGARLHDDGRLEPYPDRLSIEAGAVAGVSRPILWLEDHVEVFFAQVQGSARVVLPDGSRRRLVYDGRNGQPYSSIGRTLIERGEIPADEMTLARLKLWLRQNGLEPGQAGREILHTNRSYVFFRLEPEGDPEAGPIGAQGLPLAPMRSMAVDRTIWPYGTPVWVAADLASAGLPAGPGMLMVAQDTGSAIIGPARGDLYIGAGPAAGDIAGRIRHRADFIVFLPGVS